MNAEAIVNHQCSICLSDPWGLGEFINWRPLSGIIINYTELYKDFGSGQLSEAVIVHLNAPFTFENIIYEYLILTVRHVGDTFEQAVDSKQDIFCALTRIPEKQVHSEKPFDLDWWRGGGAAICTLKLMDNYE